MEEKKTGKVMEFFFIVFSELGKVLKKMFSPKSFGSHENVYIHLPFMFSLIKNNKHLYKYLFVGLIRQRKPRPLCPNSTRRFLF